MMKALVLTFALLLIAGGLTYHFAAIKVFNAQVSKDAGTKIAAEDVSFGPDP